MTTYWRTKPEFVGVDSGKGYVYSDHYVKMVDGTVCFISLPEYNSDQNNMWIPIGMATEYIEENFDNNRYYQVSDEEMFLELI